MREKSALYLLVISLFLIIGIDFTPASLQSAYPILDYLESVVDAAVVILTYILMKRELNFRTRVLRMAAHDMRGPLGVIRGYTELILEKSVSPEDERAMLQRIHAKSDEIIQLVSDLLDRAVIERRQVNLVKERASLKELTGRAVAEFTEQARRKNQTLKLDASDDVQADLDPARMKQVFANLLSNAIKYSPPGSELYVRVARNDNKARVSVQDRGPGLSQGEKDLIFDPFTRVKKPTTGGETSTGLGLSISKSLVELNGGKIWVESEGTGRGSTFHVELPAAQAEL
jgi:signal transduction histidine kinase